MKNDELDMNKYRQAWQAESRRLEFSAPHHTEEEIWAIVQQGSKQKRKTAPVWFGAVAAAGILLLMGALWLLTSRQETDTQIPEQYAHASSEETVSPTLPSALDATPATHPQVTMPMTNIAPWQKPENTPIQPTLTASIPTPQEPFTPQPMPADEANQKTTPPSTNPQYTPEQQAFGEQKEDRRTKVKDNWLNGDEEEHLTLEDLGYNSRTGNRSLSLIAGYDFGRSPLAGADLRIELPSRSKVCIGQLISFTYGTNSEDQPVALLLYAGGMSYYPNDQLGVSLNLGAYAGGRETDLGLAADLETTWKLSRHLTAGAGCRYLISFIDDNHGIIYLSIGYTIK